MNEFDCVTIRGENDIFIDSIIDRIPDSLRMINKNISDLLLIFIKEGKLYTKENKYEEGKNANE
jgi:hypothetical protein